MIFLSLRFYENPNAYQNSKEEPSVKFPKDFMLGATTAAHQVEGNNIYSDCWALEQMKHTSYLEPSLDAVDHYNRYEEDIRLLAQAGLNTYRFSIEWARIEPEEGRFEESEVEHYREVVRCCRENGVEPMVCMHHFSSPMWLIAKGGWESEKTIEYFRRYCVYVIERIGKELNYVCTINEANMRLQMRHIMRKYMRQAKAAGNLQMGVNLETMMSRREEADREAAEIFGLPAGSQPQTFQTPCSPEGDGIVVRAHEAARDAMKAVCPHLKIGITLSLHDFQAIPGGWAEVENRWEDEFTHYLPNLEKDDFIGIQNYTRELVGPEENVFVPASSNVTDMGYEFYPEGLAHVIRKVAKQYHGDIIVTENGVAVGDDNLRIQFIRRALKGVKSCISDGIPVKGYLYWSLLDNFEWQKAYSVKFGLIAVDRSTQKRTVKPSLAYLGSQR